MSNMCAITLFYIVFMTGLALGQTDGNYSNNFEDSFSVPPVTEFPCPNEVLVG